MPGKGDTQIDPGPDRDPRRAIGLAGSYFWGARNDREHGVDHGQTRDGAH